MTVRLHLSVEAPNNLVTNLLPREWVLTHDLAIFVNAAEVRVLCQLCAYVLKVEVPKDPASGVSLLLRDSWRQKVEHDVSTFVLAVELLDEVLVPDVNHAKQRS